HEYESSSGTVTSRLNEPPTSLSKITKNVNDYLDKPNDKKMTTSNTYSKPSSTTTTTTTTKTPPPQPSSTTTKKAEFLDGTDPNETGRNVAHIIFDQEGEDEVYKKFTKSNTASNTSSNTEGDNHNDTKPATNEDKKPENNS